MMDKEYWGTGEEIVANRFDDKVASVTKALVILEELSREPEGMGLLELSSRVEMHKTTVYRLLTSLLEKDFVEQDPITGHYSLGIKILSLANAFYQKLDVRAIIRGKLAEIPYQVKGFFLIVKRAGQDYVAIDIISNGEETTLKPGESVPAEDAAIKVFYANMPLWRMDGKEMARIRQNSSIKQDLKNITLQGYAFEEKGLEGLPCVAVPIFDYSKNVACVISFYSESLSDRRTQSDLVLWLVEAADGISAQLGFIRYL